MLFPTFSLFAVALAAQASAASVTCTTYGATACPYTEATTAQLDSLIDDFCGDNGGYPYYYYYEEINGELPDGYYTVGSDCVAYGSSQTCFNQTTCNSALEEIVSYCDVTGFWVEGNVVVEGVTFSVIPCQLA